MGQELALDDSTIGLWLPTDGLPGSDGSASDAGPAPLVYTSVGGQHLPAFTDYSPVARAYARLFTSSYGEARANGYTLARAAESVDTVMMQGSWSMEMFIRVDLLPPAGQVAGLVGLVGDAASVAAESNHQGRLGVTDSGMLHLSWRYGGAGAGTTVKQANGSPITPGVWHHIGVTKDVALKEVKFYLDGALQDTRSYITEPNGGEATEWRLSRRSTSLPGSDNDLCGAFAIRHVAVSNIVRNEAWLLASASRKNTTGVLETDSKTVRSWLLNLAPSVKDYSPIRMHLFTEGASSSNLSIPTGVDGITGDGPSRSHNAAALRGVYHPAYSAAFKSNWTWEGWYLLAGDPAVNQGFFSWGRASDAAPWSNRIYLRYEASRKKLHLSYRYGAGMGVNVWSENAGVLPFGTPLHVAVTAALRAGTWAIKLYVNSINVTQQSGASGLIPYSGGDDAIDMALNIGHGDLVAPGATRLGQFTGVVGGCRLSNVTRSPIEIRDSYAAGRLVRRA